MTIKRNIGRRIRLLLYLALMCFLIYYGQKYHPGITYADCMADPITFHNTPVDIGTEATIYKIYPDHFVISQMQQLITILGPAPKNAEVGEFVTLSGTFQKDGSIIPGKVRIAEKRHLKIGISVLPMLFIILNFFRVFTWDWKRWRIDYRHA